jgi:hypothetical protein
MTEEDHSASNNILHGVKIHTQSQLVQSYAFMFNYMNVVTEV